MSPKGNIQGTHLAIGAIRSIKTSQHDATSTLASLNEDVEEAENRIKSKLETGSYA
jgi:hypothetical protein